MSTFLSSVKGNESDQVIIKRALLSVFDKTGLVQLATYLSAQGVELLSTGGSAKMLRNAGLNVIDVSEYTGSPEILDGRVKTLHPKIHGGLLAVRGNDKHENEMVKHDMSTIDLVVVNLYPFEQAVAKGEDFNMAIENIDIGGPSMLRSSAKNHAYVTVVTSPTQYDEIIMEMKSNNGATSLTTRRKFAYRAFATSSSYDTAISNFFSGVLEKESESKNVTSSIVTRSYERISNLKYGCNPHQKPAAIYRPLGKSAPFDVVNGTPGYINMLDAMNAWGLVRELRQALNMPAAASFKHCSPAGAAVGCPLTINEAAAYEVADPSILTSTALAYVRARNADPMCSFGDFAAVSDIVDVNTAKYFKTTVCDGIIAPGFEPEALEILKSKKKGAFVCLQASPDYNAPIQEFREFYGLVFSQRRNDKIFTAEDLKQMVAGDAFPEAAVRDLVLASISIKYTQSNSVGYALNGQMIGVGAGQQSRVDCVKLAGRKVKTWYLRQHPKVMGLKFKTGVKKQDKINARVRYIEGDITSAERPIWEANFEEVPDNLTEQEKDSFMSHLGESDNGVSLASDAFFPFRDSLDHASRYGVKYIAQAGGSIADQEVIGAAKEYGISMAMTGLRLFHH